MKIAGFNITRITDAHIDDGATALLEDGHVTVALAEERANRKKHSGGFVQSLYYCLHSRNFCINDLDYVVISNCADEPLTIPVASLRLREQGVYIPENKIIINPSHHLSHAASSFYSSPFDEAIVIVCDNEGNIIGERKHPQFWLNHVERTSIYVANDRGLHLLARFGAGENEISIGAAYNYFTRWLGLKKYHEAGQVMALAPFGTGKFSDIEIFRWQDNTLRCLMIQNQKNKPESVRDIFQRQAGIDIGSERPECNDPDDMQRELAWLIQNESEAALLSLVEFAIRQTGIRRFCLAGGVFLNCVANTKIAEHADVSDIYVQPAAGDIGQAIGNVLWAYHSVLKKPRTWSMESCSFGRSYAQEEIEFALSELSESITYEKSPSIESDAARLLASGAIIGWFTGGSEYGPRALGRRSILGDPRQIETKQRLDQSIKLRAWFRPYAPSVIEESIAEWFEVSQEFMQKTSYPLQFMLIAPKFKENKRHLVPSVVHVDGSARLHAVHQSENPRFHRLISEFARLTGVPMVLNTSFNKAGEPIVETPKEALRSFLHMGLDHLIIEDYLIHRRVSDTV